MKAIELTIDLEKRRRGARAPPPALPPPSQMNPCVRSRVTSISPFNTRVETDIRVPEPGWLSDENHVF